MLKDFSMYDQETNRYVETFDYSCWSGNEKTERLHGDYAAQDRDFWRAIIEDDFVADEQR